MNLHTEVFSVPHHTHHTYTNTDSGWASHGYYNHWWNEAASRGSPSVSGAQPETWADAEVEIVDEQDRSQGRAATIEATDRKAADATGSSTGDAATDKEVAKRRLSELHRLLNSRNGSLNATCRKNAEANDKYVDFEVTVANVTHEQEAGDTLHVATLEVAEELERTLKEQSRLQDDLDSTSDALTAAAKDFTDCWAAHDVTCVRLCDAFREVSNRRAAHDEWTQRRRCNAHLKSSAEPRNRERTRRITNEHAKVEGHVNDGIGSLGKALQAAARATHSLTCGVPDRKSNETKYLRKATEFIEEWQFRLLGGKRMSAPASDHGKVILIERNK